MQTSYHAPPQRVSIRAEEFLATLKSTFSLGQVDKIRGEYQTQEAYVKRSDELLRFTCVSVLMRANSHLSVYENNAAEQTPSAALSVHV